MNPLCDQLNFNRSFSHIISLEYRLLMFHTKNDHIKFIMKLLIVYIVIVSLCFSECNNQDLSNQNNQIDSNHSEKVYHDLNSEKDVLKRAQTLNSTSGTISQVSVMKQSPCSCSGGLCACCSRFLLDFWKQKACVNVTYDPDEFSFTTKVMMNDRILYTRTISGKNPRPICVPVPRFQSVRACVRFYNIYFHGRNVHACINIEGKFQDVTLFLVGLDCVRLGVDGVAVVKPEDGGGLGQIEFLPEDVSAEEYDYEDDDDEDDDEFDYK